MIPAMNPIFTALLLSLLVFPGTGHFYLKHRKSGAILVIASLVALVALVVEIFRIVRNLMEAFATGTLAADQMHLDAILQGELAGSGSGILSLSVFMLLTCWIASIVDILRIAVLSGNATKKRRHNAGVKDL